MRLTTSVFLGVLLLAGTARSQSNLDAIMPVRGFCIASPSPSGVDRFCTFIDSELAPRHINTLVLRVDYRYQFQSHPEVVDRGALSLADVKTLLAVCRKDHIHLIPHINLLGHQSAGTNLGGLLRAHPEFDETPWVKMPAKFVKYPNPDRLYCKSYCPLQPDVHKVVFALVDELCDAFESDAFHAGMDEVLYLGEDKCPRCAGKDKAALFAGEVKAIDEHLRAHGRTMWMWGDRFLDANATGLSMWSASKTGTAPAIDMVPRDMVICDWHYIEAVPTAAYFAFKGFHVVSCPWSKASVAVQQADDMARWHQHVPPEMADRFQGVMQTVWSTTDRFLNREYQHDVKTNSWSCFVAMSDEIANLAPPPAVAK